MATAPPDMGRDELHPPVGGSVGEAVTFVAQHSQQCEAGRRTLEERRDHVDEPLRPYPFGEEPGLGEFIVAVERRYRHGVADVEIEHCRDERRVQKDVLVEIGLQPFVLVARREMHVRLGRDRIFGNQEGEIAADEAGDLLERRPPPGRIDGAIIDLANQWRKLRFGHR